MNMDHIKYLYQAACIISIESHSVYSHISGHAD